MPFIRNYSFPDTLPIILILLTMMIIGLFLWYRIVLSLLLLFNFLAVPYMASRQIIEVDYGTFMSMTENSEIGRVEIQGNQILLGILLLLHPFASAALMVYIAGLYLLLNGIGSVFAAFSK